MLSRLLTENDVLQLKLRPKNARCEKTVGLFEERVSSREIRSRFLISAILTIRRNKTED